MEFTKPRGTRDFLFDEMEKRKEVEKILRNTFENYAYREIKTPLFEDLKLFTTKSGEEIVEQLYNFEDKSNREISLRPEITAPVARLYLNELQKVAKPIKLYYFGSCFRYERPQKGRFRQFWQFGCELIGAKSPEGEAEVIAMCNDSLERLSIKTADININHLGIIRGLFKHFNIDFETQRKIMVIIDKGDKELLRESLNGNNPVTSNDELNEILLKLIDIIGDKNVLKDIENLLSKYEETNDALNEFKQLIKSLESFKVHNYTLNLGVARGLDYYTGIVFEVYIPELGTQKQVCGGGTYSLIKIFGGEEIESTGFAFGFDRLMNALEELKDEKENKSNIEVYIAPISNDTRQISFKIAQNLRENNIITEVDLSRKKFKKLLNHANNLGARKVIVVGEDELKNNQVAIKNMDSGDQELVNIDKIVSYIKED